MYPINLNLKSQTVLVVGGGKVAYRKINRLMTTEAEIILISPQVEDDLAALISNSAQIEYYQRKFKVSDITDNLTLVFAMTDQEQLNQKIAEVAREKNILVNVATSAEESSFTIPSLITQGDLLVTIATSGTAPALSKQLRLELEKRLGSEYAVFLQLMKEIRPVVLAEIADEQERRKILTRIVDLEIIELLGRDKETGIKRLKSKLPQRVQEKLDFEGEEKYV